MTKYYVDDAGHYLGGFDGMDGPEGAIEVDTAPENAINTWDGDQWVQVIEIPASVTMRQARLALLHAGLLDNVDTAIDSLTSPQKETARIEWDYSSEVVRGRPLVSLIGIALGLDEDGLNDLFVQAAAL